MISYFLVICPRIYHLTFSIIVLGYPFLCCPRVRDEVVDFLSCRIVDSLHPAFHESKYSLHERVQYTELHHILVLLRMTPVVASRSMAVDDGDWFFGFVIVSCALLRSNGSTLGVRSNPVMRRNSFFICWIASFLAMTGTIPLSHHYLLRLRTR